MRILILLLVSIFTLTSASSVSAFDFPSSSGVFGNFPFPSIKPFPSKTPQPSNLPSSTPNPSASSTPNPSTKLEILDIDPSSANYMDEFTIEGTAFGGTQGSVSFRASGQNYVSAGAQIVSWDNNKIKAKIPAVKKGTYYIQVVTSEGKKSNEERLSVKNGQPIIVSTSLNAVNGNYELTFQGTEFGRRGTINIYNGSSLVGTGVIRSWSSSRIRFNVPNLPRKEYGFQIVTSDGRQSALRMFTVGN